MQQNQKPCIKAKKVIERGKRSKTLSEVKPVENVSKNLKSFLEISLKQKEVVPLHKLQDYAYPSHRNCENQLSHPSSPHTEQECPESLIQGRFTINKIGSEASGIRKANFSRVV